MTDWRTLAEGTPQDRAAVLPSEAYRSLVAQIGVLKLSVSTCRSELFFLGMRATDTFHAMVKERTFSPEETKVYPRVRIGPRYDTPSFYWERLNRHLYRTTEATKTRSQNGRGRSYVAFVPVKGQRARVRMKVVLTSEHIKINQRTMRTTSSAFAGEPEWARIAGELVEDQLQPLRQINRQLATLSRSITRLEKLIQKLQEDL